MYIVRRIFDNKYAISVKGMTYTSRFQGHVEWVDDVNSATLFSYLWALKVCTASARVPLNNEPKSPCEICEVERTITILSTEGGPT